MIRPTMDSGAKPVRSTGPVRTGNVPMKKVKVSPQKAPDSKAQANEYSNPEDVEWFEWAQTQLQQITGQDVKISRDKFRAALNIKQSFFSERFFTIADKDKVGKVDLEEFLNGLKILTNGDGFLKLSFLFDAFDVDGKGSIDKDTLRMLLSTCTPENSLKISEEHLDALTDTLFDGAVKGGKGCITFDELYKQLKKYPSVVRNLTISAKAWLTQPRGLHGSEIENQQNSTLRYLRNNMKTIIFTVFYWLLNGALAGYSVYRNLQENYCIIIARACGLCLNFNCVFAVVLTLRYCLTLLRNTKIGCWFPVNERIMFHKMVAMFIVVLALVHSVAHIGNIALIKNTPNSSFASLAYWEILFTTKAAIGFLGFGLAYLSGMILVGILFFICIFSIPCIRRNGHFEVFCWAHALYICLLGLLVIHSSTFWMFLVGPGVIFLLEKFIACTLCRRKNHGKFYITKVNLLPSKVTHLVISRPPSFTYRPGDYVFINVPAVASHEWHAFAISSAPELQDEFWLHVQIVGPWTRGLYAFFNNYEENENEGIVNRTGAVCHGGTQTVVLETVENGMCTNQHNNNQEFKVTNRRCLITKSKKTRVKIFIDGPYRVSSHSKIYNAPHAVLITSGIGAIPFASILQSMVYQIKNSHSHCPGCSLEWYDLEKRKNNVKKIDFIWINPDQRCFEWLINLLMNLEFELKKKKGAIRDYLEMQIFMTAASDKKDLKGIGLQMALDTLYQRIDGDPPVTVSKLRTEAGHPNFDEVFTKIAVAGVGQVEVFFCGQPVLANCVKGKCKQYGLKFSRVRF